MFQLPLPYPRCNEIKLKIVQSEYFFLFFFPRARCETCNSKRGGELDSFEGREDRVDKGQSAGLAVPVVPIEITSWRIGKCDGAANGRTSNQ